MIEWIDVNDRLPEESGDVLVYRGSHMTVCTYSKKHRLFNAFDDCSKKDAKKYCIEVSHWMPLPGAPKK